MGGLKTAYLAAYNCRCARSSFAQAEAAALPTMASVENFYLRY